MRARDSMKTRLRVKVCVEMMVSVWGLQPGQVFKLGLGCLRSTLGIGFGLGLGLRETKKGPLSWQPTLYARQMASSLRRPSLASQKILSCLRIRHSHRHPYPYP